MARGSKKKRNDANREVSTRDLRKLKRSELLEIMLAQSEEIDGLRKQLAEKDRQLHARAITIEESGSIAEAALKLTNVFQEAQAAADLYLDNVKARATGTDPDAGAPQAPEAAAENSAASAGETAETLEGQSAHASAESDSYMVRESQPSDQGKPGEPGKTDRAGGAAQPNEATDAVSAPDATDSARTVHAAHVNHSFIAEETAIIDPITLDNIDARLDAADGSDFASAGELPRSQAAGQSRQAGAQAADGVHYEPGQDLKSIEELIDDLKVNGTKHRG